MSHGGKQKARRRGGRARHLSRSTLFLVALAGLAALFRQPFWEGFQANPYLNGTILAIFGVGVAITLKALIDVFRDAGSLDRASDIVEDVRYQTRSLEQMNHVLLTASREGIASFLETVHRVVRQGNAGGTLPYLLDSLATRAEDRRALVRYLTGALVLLGLIGTFYGLLITVGGVREVIAGLSEQANSQTSELLGRLSGGLSLPLNGMAIAFSSSLFGLLGSLSLAFLELQLFHAQSEVHARLESLVVSDLVPLWDVPALRGPGAEQATPSYLTALVETAAERLDQVAGLLEAATEREARSARTNEQLSMLGERIESLRQTLEALERDRMGDLRHELRLLARTLSHGDLDRAPKT